MEQIGWEVAGIISEKIRELAAKKEVDTKEGEFMVIQPLTDNQALWYEMTFTDKGKRKINIKVNDSVYILPKIDKNFEIFTDESEEEDNNLTVERYDEDQIVMIGPTLQDRKAGDVEIFVNEDVSVFRITTDDNDHCFLKINIGVDITSFDTFFEILNLIKEYMENL